MTVFKDEQTKRSPQQMLRMSLHSFMQSTNIYWAPTTDRSSAPRFQGETNAASQSLW